MVAIFKEWLDFLKRSADLVSVVLGVIVAVTSVTRDNDLFGAGALQSAVDAQTNAENAVERARRLLIPPLSDAICATEGGAYRCDVPGGREGADTAAGSLLRHTMAVVTDNALRAAPGPNAPPADEIVTDLLGTLEAYASLHFRMNSTDVRQALMQSEHFGNGYEFAEKIRSAVDAKLVVIQGKTFIPRPQEWQLWALRFAFLVGGCLIGIGLVLFLRRIAWRVQPSQPGAIATTPAGAA